MAIDAAAGRWQVSADPRGVECSIAYSMSPHMHREACARSVDDEISALHTLRRRVNPECLRARQSEATAYGTCAGLPQQHRCRLASFSVVRRRLASLGVAGRCCSSLGRRCSSLRGSASRVRRRRVLRRPRAEPSRQASLLVIAVCAVCLSLSVPSRWGLGARFGAHRPSLGPSCACGRSDSPISPRRKFEVEGLGAANPSRERGFRVRHPIFFQRYSTNRRWRSPSVGDPASACFRWRPACASGDRSLVGEAIATAAARAPARPLAAQFEDASRSSVRPFPVGPRGRVGSARNSRSWSRSAGHEPSASRTPW